MHLRTFLILTRSTNGPVAHHWTTQNAAEAERLYNRAVAVYNGMLVLLFKVPHHDGAMPEFNQATGWLMSSDGAIPDGTVLLLRSLAPARSPHFPYAIKTGWIKNCAKPMSHIWDVWDQLVRPKRGEPTADEPAPKRLKQQ